MKLIKILNILSKILLTISALIFLMEICLITKLFYICKNEYLRTYFKIESYDCKGESYDIGVSFIYIFSFVIFALLISAIIIHLYQMRLKAQS